MKIIRPIAVLLAIVGCGAPPVMRSLESCCIHEDLGESGLRAIDLNCEPDERCPCPKSCACKAPRVLDPDEYQCIGIVSDSADLYALLNEAGIRYTTDGSILYSLDVEVKEAARAKELLLANREGKGFHWFMTLQEYGEWWSITEAIRMTSRRGEQRFRKGYVDDAIGTFTAAIRMTPDDPLYRWNLIDLHLLRAKALERKGEVERAIADLEKGLRLDREETYRSHNMRVKLKELRKRR